MNYEMILRIFKEPSEKNWTEHPSNFSECTDDGETAGAVECWESFRNMGISRMNNKNNKYCNDFKKHLQNCPNTNDTKE